MATPALFSAATGKHIDDVFSFALAASNLERSRELLIIHLLHSVCGFFDPTPRSFLDRCVHLLHKEVLSSESLFQVLSKKLSMVDGSSGDSKEWCMGSGLSAFQRDFICLECLGQGGFGEVFHTVNRLDGQEYAVKRVRISGDSKLQARMLREVSCWAQLDHRHVCRYFHAWLETDAQASQSAFAAIADAFSCHGSSPEESYRRAVEDVDCGIRDSAATSVEVARHSVDEEDASAADYGNLSRTGSTVVFECSQEETMPPAEHFTGVLRPGRVSEKREARPCRESDDCSAKLAQSSFLLYIQMELCQHETLAHRLQKRNLSLTGPLSQEHILDSLRIFGQVLLAMEHFHSHGVIHRDIKPSNVVFSLDGDVRLTDFGLAKQTCQVARVGSARSSSPRASGTRAYASPEQAAGGLVSDKTDIYSLGLVLVELFVPLRTEMERAEVFSSARKFCSMPDSLQHSFPNIAGLAEAMMDPIPELRPSTSDIIHGEWPQRLSIDLQAQLGTASDLLVPLACRWHGDGMALGNMVAVAATA